MLENKRLSASPRKGKRKLEEGEPNKEEATSRKKSKSATGVKAHEEKNDTEETEKEGSEMETDELEGEDNYKDEDLGAEDEEGENESDNDSPIYSATPSNDNNQPMVRLEELRKKKEQDVINFSIDTLSSLIPGTNLPSTDSSLAKLKLLCTIVDDQVQSLEDAAQISAEKKHEKDLKVSLVKKMDAHRAKLLKQKDDISSAMGFSKVLTELGSYYCITGDEHYRCNGRIILSDEDQE
ncbi:uncharacterized protein LOC131069814 [Cryptomeria japonica]|uniref:uncharacterized protein LOC131069814 n=1 Tax=Cryptomeria japonica TaxID=3369 RepID=UPI0025ACA5C2|nr:uncharacterized protein LOC131069814 [Cryptomeria japonica]